jgi:hypothetical protein
MKLWSIFHVYSTVTSTDVMHWILAFPMRDSRATDVTHWILALPMRDIHATDFLAQIRSLLIAMILNSSNVDPAI